MWISKKKWAEIESTLKEFNMLKSWISEDHNRLNRLISSHNKVEEKEHYNEKYDILVTNYNHNNISTINTDKISDITLEELARFVIDKTPIERTVTEDKVVKYENK